MKRASWVVLTGVLLCATSGTGLGSAVAQDAEWAYRQLDLEVSIDPAGSRLEVRGAAVLEPGGGTGSRIRLLLNAREPAMRFDELTTPGTDAEVTFSAADSHRYADILLAEPRNPGDSVAIAFRLGMEQASMQLVVSDSVALASWVEAWYPVPESDGTQRRAAPGSTRFHLPPGWSAVSNGTPDPIGSDDTAPGPHRWHTTEAVNRSFAAGPYQSARRKVGDREIGVYLLLADSASASSQAAVLAQAIRAMEDVWGPFPYEGYAIVEVPDAAVAWAAASEQGFIMATSSQFGDHGNLPLFAHEAAHAWWGNRVHPTGPGSMVVGESLAQYGAVVAIEAIEGADAMNEFLRFSRDNYSAFQSANGYFEIVRRGCDKPLARLPDDRWDPWHHHLSDAKGHWFYHMLRHRIGDDRFFGVLRDLLEDFDGRALSLAEVRQGFVDAAPDDPGLPAFLSQWLDRTGAPVLEERWWATDEGHTVRLEISQIQPNTYDLNLTVELELANGHRLQRNVHLRDRTQRFDLKAHDRVIDVRLDPDHRLLFWRPEFGPLPSQLTDAQGPTADITCQPLEMTPSASLRQPRSSPAGRRIPTN